MSPQVFQYRNDINNLNPKDLSAITIDQLMMMSMPEFLNFQNRLVNVRHRKRRDMALYEKTVITPQHHKAIFRKGVGQEDSYATSDTRYTKTRAHTNMQRDGEFQQGSLVIIKDISAIIEFTAGIPTTVEHGLITNAKAVFPTNYDNCLALSAWKRQVELVYKEGESEIVKGDLSEFPQNDGVSGFNGASPGGIAQNAFQPSMAFPNPRVLQGGDDFSVEIRPLCNFDTSQANGINQVIRQIVELYTVELVTVKV